MARRPLFLPARPGKGDVSVRRPHIPVLILISLVHLLSHVYIMVIPSLLPLLPKTLNVSFVELGAAVSVFNLCSAAAQAPMGFVVDRFGAWRVLFIGIAVGTGSFIFLFFFPSYVGLLAAMAFAGVANGVYHPSDYAILSRSIRESIMGKAFSVHSFAGYAGSAMTPALAVACAVYFGVPAAFGATALLGLAVLALFLVSYSGDRKADDALSVARATDKTIARLPLSAVLTAPVFALMVLYIFLCLSTISIERFSVSALIQGYDTALPLANTALTAFLLCSAFGVLSGGELADRTRRHGYVAVIAFALAAVLSVVLAVASLPPFILVAVYALIGFLTGVIVPSRDMLVRAASPKGGEGKVFGLASTGFNIGGTLGPLMFGYFLDHGMPSAIFWAAAAFMATTVCLTWAQEWMRGRKP